MSATSYDLGMKRLVVVLSMLGVATFAGAGPAGAEPAEQGCAVNLSAPRVVEQFGVSTVTASVSPGECHRAAPMLQVACLQRVGGQSAPLCAQTEGPGAAVVNLSPHTPGTGYVVTGRVCANAGSPPVTYCQAVGPTTVTL